MVFELILKDEGSVKQEPVVKIYEVLNYKDYLLADGKQTLSETDYITYALRDEAGMVTFESSDKYEYTWSQYSQTQDKLFFKFSFVLPSTDYIGQSMIWYHWTFFNDEEDQPLSNAIIYGNQKPFQYSLYYFFEDFFDIEFIMNSFYVSLSVSFFWVIGMPVQMLIAFIV